MIKPDDPEDRTRIVITGTPGIGKVDLPSAPCTGVICLPLYM